MMTGGAEPAARCLPCCAGSARMRAATRTCRGLIRVLLASDPADAGGVSPAGWPSWPTTPTGTPPPPPASGSATSARTPATWRARSPRRTRARADRDDDGPVAAGAAARHAGRADHAPRRRRGRGRARRGGAAGDAAARCQRRRDPAAVAAGAVRDRGRAAGRRGQTSSTGSTRSTPAAAAFGGGRLPAASAGPSWLLASRRPRGRAAALPRVRGRGCARPSSPASPGPGCEPWALFGDAHGAQRARLVRDGRGRGARARRLFARLPGGRARGCSRRTNDAARLPGGRAGAVRTGRVVPAARRSAPAAGRAAAARAGRPVRLQPHDPDHAVGADHARRPRRRCPAGWPQLQAEYAGSPSARPADGGPAGGAAAVGG